MSGSKVDQVIAEFAERLRQAVLEDFVLNATGGKGERTVKLPKSSPGPKKAAQAKGGKRTPEDLEALKRSIVAFVRKNPGSRTEAISQGLGVPTKELQLPMSQLRDSKELKMKGQRRAATYTVA